MYFKAMFAADPQLVWVVGLSLALCGGVFLSALFIKVWMPNAARDERAASLPFHDDISV